jgi:protein-S-isoprenylcysteine O-methyltransferase
VRVQIYLCSLAIAHLSEYLFVASYHTHQLNWDSFLINQSKFYVLAHAIAVTEYTLKYFFLPSLELLEGVEWLIRMVTLPVGLIMLAIGHTVRITAMFTAARSFHHLVQYRHKEGHVLVTNGIYAYLRHPSYFGWFVWCLGTQVVLINPVSWVGFYFASVKFFVDRVPDEELLLEEFFGEDYIDYALRTPIWIPEVQAASPFKF